MKILFLAHRTPYPPDKGDKIRSYHILTQLARRHVISLAYWVDDPQDWAHSKVLNRICHGRMLGVPLETSRARLRGLASLARGRSCSEGYYYSRGFQRALDRIIREQRPDLIYVFSSVMAQYVERYTDIPRIVDFVDVDSDKWGQLSRFAKFPMAQLYGTEQARLAKHDVAVSGWAQLSVFVSQAEADLFRELGGQGPILVVPNGVDSKFRRLPIQKKHHDGNDDDFLRPIKLLFIGTMNYYPNADAVLYFAREIFPLIRRNFPRAIFEVVGRFPSKPVRRLDGKDGVRVVGEVPEVRSFLSKADVSVAPMRIARGVPNKLLEAMAMGVPVVATPHAIQGLEVHADEEILIGANPEQFAVHVLRVVTDPQLRVSMTKKAWARMRQAYNWHVIGARLNTLISMQTHTGSADPEMTRRAASHNSNSRQNPQD